MHLCNFPIMHYLTQVVKPSELISEKLKLTIITTATMDAFSRVLKVDFDSINLPLDFTNESFDRVEIQVKNQLISESTSTITWLQLYLRDFSDAINFLEEKIDTEEINLKVNELLESFTRIRGEFRVVSTLPEILTEFPNKPEVSESFLRKIVFAINETISRAAIVDPRLILLDYKSVISTHDNIDFFDVEDFALHSQPFKFLGMKEISQFFVRLIGPTRMVPAKLLLLDLDNTLWPFVLGEVGTVEILSHFKNAESPFYKLQEKIKSLQNKGLLLAILSKNNLGDVQEVFANANPLPLDYKDFVCVKANWNEKYQNILEIAEELNLGLESFVFFDDNPVERELVRNFLPQIFVPEIQNGENFLSLIDLLFPLSIESATPEDLIRNNSYLVKKSFDSHITQVTDKVSFLKSLNMKVQITTNSQIDTSRAFQLIQKTNQFNMTGLRMTIKELEDNLQKSTALFFMAGLKDIYGDSGNTLLVMIELQDLLQAEIRIFNMSCRIIGRNFEFFMLDWVLLELIRLYKVQVISVHLNRTEKNNSFIDFFKDFGFESKASNLMSLSLANYESKVEYNYFQVEERKLS